MRAPVYTRQFERDIKKARKRGKNLDKFKIIARGLIEGKKLDPLHRDHQLIGYYAGRRECHIEADWLLIYKLEKDHIVSTTDVLRGKPRIKGTRIPVSLVLGYLAAGSTFEDIITELPDLTKEQIAACLDYARDLSEFEVAV